MIIRLKNGMEYALGKKEGKSYLLTYEKEKTDATFEWWKNRYWKEIDLYDKCVDECFEYYWYVVYDVGIPGVRTDWRLMGDSDVPNNVAYLIDNANHEGWEYVERNVSRKRIKFSDVKDQYVLKVISVRNGKNCIPKKKERINLSKEEYVKLWQKTV